MIATLNVAFVDFHGRLKVLQANGRAERDVALVMLEQVPGDGRITMGGDKGFDTAEQRLKSCIQA
jgi:hypothetical protein